MEMALLALKYFKYHHQYGIKCQPCLILCMEVCVNLKAYLKPNNSSFFLLHSCMIANISTNHKTKACPAANQIYLVTFMCLTVDTSFIFTKRSNVAKMFFDICNTEMAQVGWVLSCKRLINVQLSIVYKSEL